ncbi:alpha/beta hydrolase [Candidatus Marsarchaeota archaeon]|nr:alpha/beta hydrolase [Candidatus Marsarchaeota archaeon]
MKMSSFDYLEHRMAYFYAKGDKGNVILMHGYSFNSRVWEEIGLVERLNGQGYCIFCIDVPGFPKSANSEGLTDVEMTGFLEAFIRTLHGNVVMLGSSASGYLALKFAEKHSRMLAGLIVVAPVNLERVMLDSITTHVLGIWGSKDTVSPVGRNGRMLQSIKNSKIRVLEGAAHACYLDKPQDFIDIISNFIKNKLVGL